MGVILDRPSSIVTHHDKCTELPFVHQIQQARETLEKLLTLLQSALVERDRFVSHLYHAQGNTGERAKLPDSPTSKSKGV